MDATILVEADMAILTTISMDHSEYLGDTITEIAREGSDSQARQSIYLYQA